MGYKRRTSRFHVDTGPCSLFERVRFKMQSPRRLKCHGKHVSERALQRGAPLEAICDFDPKEWDLMTAEVDEAKGKFVSSAWSRKIEGRTWWVVIGLGDSIKTVIEKESDGLHERIVHSGALFKRVDATNRELMAQEFRKE
ncbi:hypothetical protein [Halomonas denitrificans]|nr:hypothetical protein [Halomonas denitrificans]